MSAQRRVAATVVLIALASCAGVRSWETEGYGKPIRERNDQLTAIVQRYLVEVQEVDPSTAAPAWRCSRPSYREHLEHAEQYLVRCNEALFLTVANGEVVETRLIIGN